MSYERTNGSGDTMDTETVWVKSVISPELEVVKNTSQYEWKTGDTVDYEVSVSQTKPDVRAVNVVITDEIPACLQLLEGSIQCRQVTAQKAVRSPDRETMAGKQNARL